MIALNRITRKDAEVFVTAEVRIPKISVPEMSVPEASASEARLPALSRKFSSKGLLFMTVALIWILFLEMPTFAIRQPDKTTVDSDSIIRTDRIHTLADSPSLYSVQRTMTFENGAFFVREITDRSGKERISNSYFIPGTELTVYYFDSEKNLVSREMENGTLPITTVFLRTEHYDYAISPAFQFVDTDDRLITRQKQDIPVKVTKKENRFMITYEFPPNQGAKNVLWGIYSTKKLIDFERENVRHILSGLDLTENAVLGLRGYHYIHPLKKAEKTYYLSPSPYLATSFVRTGGSRFADLMGQCFLNIHIEQLNSEGYFPTLHNSIWLQTDYGIDAPYFDNRWNSDLVLTLLCAYEKYQDEEYLKSAERILHYFLSYVDSSKKAVSIEHLPKDAFFETKTEKAYLIPDYIKGFETPYNHTSLNHQLSVITMFLKAYDITKNKKYEDCAGMLLKGIEAVGDRWIRQDHDLHYLIDRFGNFDRDDYKYLTYNDLKDTQYFLNRLYGKTSPALQRLIDSKKLRLEE